MIRLSTSLDFPERLIDEKDEISVLDNKFYKSVDMSTKLINNHYEIALPFKNEETVLPDNKDMVLKRLQNLKTKLQRNEGFFKDYLGFMSAVLENGYAEEIKLEDINTENSKKWYIPHHGVYHKQKKKLRIVFDCSAKYNGISLNDVLLSGPDLANTLVGVLMRFRLGKIAFMSDIDEDMFHQVKVQIEDRDSLRFFWWKDGKIDTKPTEYRMTSHLFGAVSSPSIANFALQKTTEDFEDLYDEEIRKTILHNFYVVDCLKSLDDKQSAIIMIEKLHEICSRAGFNLRKWICNNSDILETIPASERAQSKQPSFGENNDTMERALGVNWDVASDNLTFKINVKNQPTTRRGLLSIIASIYDPLGFAAPALLPPKLLLQELCHQGLAWDEKISEKQKLIWLEWLKQLSDLENVKIPRYVKTSNFEEIVSAQIHSFSDASQRGYGVSCYLRLVDRKGTINCSLILGKARVSPLKKVTIPRLELTAATTSVKLTKKILEEIMIRIDDIFYWTDSTAVLHYINNEESRYKTFVANRVNLIRECTDPQQWRYINTAENPADEASRGKTVKALIDNKRWFNGPNFLSKPESDWPNNKPIKELPEE